jgi:hypothetical protein
MIDKTQPIENEKDEKKTNPKIKLGKKNRIISLDDDSPILNEMMDEIGRDSNVKLTILNEKKKNE